VNVDKKMMRLIVRMVERGQADPACECVAVTGPKYGSPKGEMFVRRFYMRTGKGNGDAAWICIDGMSNSACRRAPAPEEMAPGYGVKWTLLNLCRMKAFASLPVLALLGFPLETDCMGADHYEQWADLLRQLERGDLALDLVRVMNRAHYLYGKHREEAYEVMMAEILNGLIKDGDQKFDDTGLRWKLETKLSIKTGLETETMNACARRVLKRAGLWPDREGWYRMPKC